MKAAEQSAVLLKNDDKILPGNTLQKAAVIGAFAKEPRYQGAGSSKIHPIKVDNAHEELTRLGLKLTYAQGYSLKSVQNNNTKAGSVQSQGDKEQAALITEACETAKGKDIVYIFIERGRS
jgi:beta-glucosidase